MSLAGAAAFQLLDRMRRSPFGGDWLRGAALGLNIGEERLFLSTTRVMPYALEAVDAWLVASEDDLAAMLGNAPPPGQVGFKLGSRLDAAPRIMQARALLTLAALGWAGPWPDPAADAELHALTRRAVLDLAVGPNDGWTSLFPSSAPPEIVSLSIRLTDGARPKRCTVGLSDAPGAPEFWTEGPPWLLRVAVLHWVEVGSVPTTLETDRGILTFSASPLPLPRGLSRLVRVREIAP